MGAWIQAMKKKMEKKGPKGPQHKGKARPGKSVVSKMKSKH